MSPDPRVSTVQAEITQADSGSFRAIASTADKDRDNEIIRAHAFDPLPSSLPVHANHEFKLERVVARAVPYYDPAGRLMIDARFGSGAAAQEVRKLVAEKLIDSVSVAFINAKRETVKGIATIVSGELVSVDLVSVPSNRSALVLSSRSVSRDRAGRAAHELSADTLAWLARLELREAKQLLARTDTRGRVRRHVDHQIRQCLSPDSAAQRVARFLRSI